MRTLFLLSAVLAVAAGTAAQAQNAAPAAASRSDPNAVKCRQLQVTGSLVRKERVCKTNAEWRSIAEGQNREADDFITRTRTGMNPSG
ncbi:hypothetical protein [Sphingomonas sp. C3-2]|uniref:hypothetical protein n=1 Tax=Sphingomonas sp. C3-2 TaxID=3062169 RepID=UPI00294B21DA|nr:hypothetical protein [Sphingomonas sp. C3-2]WOK37868.1 hypothetical protein QYC26_06695 [Sphingomonas sp. C3-2]